MARHASTTPRRNAQLVRLLRILRDLDTLGGLDVYTLSERYGASTRTIRRDFDALQEAGYPLEQVADGKRLRWQLSRATHGRKAALALNAGHFLALKWAEGAGGPVRSVPTVLASLEDLGGKIERALGLKGRTQLAGIEACFFTYDKFAYAHTAKDILWPLIDAIVHRRVCRVHYKTPKHAGATRVFDVLPLKLFVHMQAPYLMCQIRKHRALASLNLQRLVELEDTKMTAQRPRDFDPEALQHAAFGVWTGGVHKRFVLRFDAAIAPYIAERQWHPSQHIARHKDGGLTLTFRCAASVEIEAWVATWREHVTVQAPQSLRKRFAEVGASLVARYS